MSDQAAGAALFVAALVGMFLGAWAVVRSEARRVERLRLELLAATERAEHLDGAELERRVLAFRIRTGRAVR